MSSVNVGDLPTSVLRVGPDEIFSIFVPCEIAKKHVLAPVANMWQLSVPKTFFVLEKLESSAGAPAYPRAPEFIS